MHALHAVTVREAILLAMTIGQGKAHSSTRGASRNLPPPLQAVCAWVWLLKRLATGALAVPRLPHLSKDLVPRERASELRPWERTEVQLIHLSPH
eukprot:scaffold439_cov415-Prasinococcus_capsulatus_cf.AAC.9